MCVFCLLPSWARLWPDGWKTTVTSFRHKQRISILEFGKFSPGGERQSGPATHWWKAKRSHNKNRSQVLFSCNKFNRSGFALFWPVHFFYWLSMTYAINVLKKKNMNFNWTTNILFPQWEKKSGGPNLWFCLGNKYLQVTGYRGVPIKIQSSSFRLSEWSEKILCSLFH